MSRTRPITPAISIHAPVKGATVRITPACGSTGHFNPRSREGSDHHCDGSTANCVISIHAPVKGATSDCCRSGRDISISIHAPVKGATLTCMVVMRHLVFQSTLP